MAEESDAWIERLEKASQESREHMAKMMELIRTLIKDKGQASSPGSQNEAAQHDQRREEPVYPVGFTPLMLRMSIWHKHHLCNKPEAFSMVTHLAQYE